MSTFSSIDEQELALNQELERQALAQDDADARVELLDKEARRRTWARLAACGIWHDITGDLETVHRALGQRSVGLRELARYQRHPDLFLQMWTEAIKREREAERAGQVARAKRQREATPDDAT